MHCTDTTSKYCLVSIARPCVWVQSPHARRNFWKITLQRRLMIQHSVIFHSLGPVTVIVIFSLLRVYYECTSTCACTKAHVHCRKCGSNNCTSTKMSWMRSYDFATSCCCIKSCCCCRTSSTVVPPFDGCARNRLDWLACWRKPPSRH